MGFWNSVMNGLKNRLQGNVVANDVISWNPETHPDGPGRSYLVKDIDYNNRSGKMDVTYNDGFTAQYDATRDEAKDFVNSDSKGRWAHENLWNRPYT